MSVGNQFLSQSLSPYFHTTVKQVLTFNKGHLWLVLNKQTDDAAVTALNGDLKRMHESGDIGRIISAYR